MLFRIDNPLGLITEITKYISVPPQFDNIVVAVNDFGYAFRALFLLLVNKTGDLNGNKRHHRNECDRTESVA